MMKKNELLQYIVNSKGYAQFPLPWEDIFGRKAPLAVEIGFGNGLFLANWAIQKPGWNFIGIELSNESVRKLQKHIRQESISNVRILKEDAGFAIREFFPNESLREVVMNFPDPWPKERHRHRRLIKPSFIRSLGSNLEKGGKYSLATDQEWYARQALEQVRQSVCFRVDPVENNPTNTTNTKYAQKWLNQSRDIHQLTAIKLQSATIHRILEEVNMPHIIVDKEINSKMIRQLNGLEKTESEKLFVVKSVFKEMDGDLFLLRVVSKDQDYKQSYYITVTPQTKDKWVVKTDAGLPPYPTPAVKLAVLSIGERLKKL
ncbi:MAG: tRNA (guanosine(46)-N7)-methyltransferase TrmB [Calditrichae bacterium]|nr:tRNA (guanosine(46)-N7)-methyltransferase TrmB [Calditrichia bacterium]NIW78192.1 tRNA (guanosine(46)-N7)-methyltransferase TrmB [Calditrichia bacterium]